MPKRRDGGGVIVERVPNLFWHSTDMQQLRHHRAFYSLPSEGDVVLEGRHAARCAHTARRIVTGRRMLLTSWSPAHRRFVRQDSDLWSQLHQGVLTTGEPPVQPCPPGLAAAGCACQQAPTPGAAPQSSDPAHNPCQPQPPWLLPRFSQGCSRLL
jgi:hypothetical protein